MRYNGNNDNATGPANRSAAGRFAISALASICKIIEKSKYSIKLNLQQSFRQLYMLPYSSSVASACAGCREPYNAM
jgi:hypothetical protein